MRNKTFTFLMLLLLPFLGIRGEGINEHLQLHYTFSSQESSSVVQDQSGNGYDGDLKNAASFLQLGEYTLLSLGEEKGYVDMREKTGELIAGLDGDYSIATYVYIPNAADITANGNFVWSFANSTDIGTDANGNMFYSAMNQRFAISKTNWTGEEGIGVGQNFPKGEWKHLVCMQDGSTARVYIDGVQVLSGTFNLRPADLGATPHNFIGRSPYNGDDYLSNSYITDFRIYDAALSVEDIHELMSSKSALAKEYVQYEVEQAKNSLFPDGLYDVKEDIELPTEIGDGISVTWASSNPHYLTNDGKVTRPAIGEPRAELTLIAILVKDGVMATVNIEVHITPEYTDEEAVEVDAEELGLKGRIYVREYIGLPLVTSNESTIEWTSDKPEYLNNAGYVVKLPAQGEGEVEVTLTAKITRGASSQEKQFTVIVPELEEYTAYLFAYFTGNSGNQEAIRFALSNDGYNYKALNNNEPILDSKEISAKGGVRDPHILRGEDGNTFYMVVTDMKSDNGWDSNHGFVMLKSDNLVDWTWSRIDIKEKYPEFAKITRAWAPQVIYDPEVSKYMVYWSMYSINGEPDVIYYSYANDDFTDLETYPEILFANNGKSVIDGDIIYKDGLYHLFMKTEGDGNKGIKKAVSPTLTGEYVLYDKYLQQTSVDVEGSGVFRLINSDTYILMYDMYGNGSYQFTESTDLENFTVIDEEVTMNFHPRHGTVMTITQEEAERLAEQWGPDTEIKIEAVLAKEAKKINVVIDEDAQEVYVPVRYGTDLEAFDPKVVAFPGTKVTPEGLQDFTNGAVNYTFSLRGQEKTYAVTAQVNNNPALEGYYADPEVLYSKKTNKFYIYPTADGYAGWGGYYFKVFSSDDLVNWVDEGVIIDLKTDQVTWADRNAWAPCIEEKMIDGEYKYFFYFTAAQKVGVAVSDNPTGPFIDSGQALVSSPPAGVGGQEIDPDVFTDPKTNKSYLYWGNMYMAGAELNDDMVSIDESTIKVMTPNSSFREGVYVIYRKGVYYFLWSEDDTGSQNYKVRWAKSDSPLGSLTIPSNNYVIRKDVSKGIYGTGHNSIVKIPGRDEWYIVYHRFTRPHGINMSSPGTHRETCIDRMYFDEEGNIVEVIPTVEGIDPVTFDPDGIEEILPTATKDKISVYPNPSTGEFTVKLTNDTRGKILISVYDMSGQLVKNLQDVKEGDEYTKSLNIAAEDGMYFVTVNDGISSLNTKLIIRK